MNELVTLFNVGSGIYNLVEGERMKKEAKQLRESDLAEARALRAKDLAMREQDKLEAEAMRKEEERKMYAEKQKNMYGEKLMMKANESASGMGALGVSGSQIYNPSPK